jgi:hypothetical protein
VAPAHDGTKNDKKFFFSVKKKKKKERGRRLYDTTGSGEAVDGIPILQDYRILVLNNSLII